VRLAAGGRQSRDREPQWSRATGVNGPTDLGGVTLAVALARSFAGCTDAVRAAED
jgi:hypothetical protein